jgi:hypothetical protein
MKIKVENAYSDGHESERTIVVQDVEFVDLDDDAEAEEMGDYLYEFTGDGHGIGKDVGSYYTVTILEAADSKWVGRIFDWGD